MSRGIVSRKQLELMRKAKFGYSRLHPPTVDEVIDRIRIKYDIVIYNSHAPFVHHLPTGKKQIVY